MSLVMNSAINIAALSLTAGLFAADYVYDNHWFNYLFEDSSVLKSRVVASVRTASADHYKVVAGADSSKITYTLIVLHTILLLSLTGLIIRATKNRISNIMTLLLALSSIGTHIVITLPALGVLGGNSRAAPMAESKALRDVALGHVVVVLASMFGVSLQMGNLEVDEVAATAPAQTKKKN